MRDKKDLINTDVITVSVNIFALKFFGINNIAFNADSSQAMQKILQTRKNNKKFHSSVRHLPEKE